MKVLDTLPTVRFRLIPIRGISEEDEHAWRALGARAVEPNPLFEPDCLIPIAVNDPRGERVHLAVTEQTEETEITEHNRRFLAAVPLWDVMPTRMPYRVATSHVRRMHNLGTPLVDPSADADALVRLLKGVAHHPSLGRPRVLYLDMIVAAGPVAALLRDAVAKLGYSMYVADTYERGFLRRRPNRDYEHTHSAKARYNLRRQRRQLSEDFGGAELRLVARDPTDPASVADYVALEASGYKGRSNVAMTTASGEAEAFRDMCLGLASAGRVHILALEVSDKTIAMQVWLRGREGLFLAKISYDEQFARYGPGVLLQTEAMTVFHDQTDAEWIDTCTYKDNATLLRLYPERRQIESLFVVLGRNPFDVAAFRALLALRSLRRRGHALRRAETASPGSAEVSLGR